ncbi:hypothetical protein SLUN_01400 [Streptomyces lunaelactis]|uniref:Uncharacterized protein n=1 Tax=Streptomyces lunaelactis TaxID=1535768 RepID=A0A2R4SW49_9ACTN|nr:hypothetical protein SLUN_01400 [Streptomyces lunaelactis]
MFDSLWPACFRDRQIFWGEPQLVKKRHDASFQTVVERRRVQLKRNLLDLVLQALGPSYTVLYQPDRAGLRLLSKFTYQIMESEPNPDNLVLSAVMKRALEFFTVFYLEVDQQVSAAAQPCLKGFLLENNSRHSRY